jgi:serine/threonine protein phosphatase PrpC
MSIHSVSLKGKRPQNEDKHSIILNYDGRNRDDAPVDYFAVYDGHGGKFVSKFLSENLPQFFTDSRVVYPLKKDYVERVYSRFTEILKQKHFEYANQMGSTCLVAIRYKKNDGDYINVLNTGDSRCILCRNNLEVALTKDHKPNWPEEQYRIERLGGKIAFDGYDWRINDLSVSRAFGDLESAPYLTNYPDIFRYKLTPSDKFLVLACDGLWDVMSNQDVVNFILSGCYDMSTGKKINKNINIAKRLAEQAIMRGSTDNVSIIVVFLN